MVCCSTGYHGHRFGVGIVLVKGIPEATVKPDISKQILSLAAAELCRMENENDSWRGAYSALNVVDGDTTNRRISGIYNTQGNPHRFSKRSLDRLSPTCNPKVWPKHHHGLFKEKAGSYLLWKCA